MRPATRIRATTLLAFVLSVPTALTLFAGDIGVTTATVRVMLAIAVAMAAVGVLGAILDKAPPSVDAAPGSAAATGADETVAEADAVPVPEAIPPPPISAFVEPPPLEDRIPAAEPPVFGDLDDGRAVEDQPPL